MAANVEAWNRLFKADKTGLLPAELTETVPVSDRRRDWWRVKSFQEDHPALSFFADERWKALLTEVPIYAFLGARPLSDARVLASLDDPGSSPLLIERSYDRGRVFLWTTTIDAGWARVAESPRTLVPLVHELLRYAGTPAAPPLNVDLGVPFVAELTSYPQRPVVLRPDGARRPLEAEPSEVAPGVWRLPPVADTDRAGLYRVELEGGTALPFAVHFDAAESDLSGWTPTRCRRCIPRSCSPRARRPIHATWTASRSRRASFGARWRSPASPRSSRNRCGLRGSAAGGADDRARRTRVAARPCRARRPGCARRSSSPTHPSCG
jgi:hypothetical protein